MFELKKSCIVAFKLKKLNYGTTHALLRGDEGKVDKVILNNFLIYFWTLILYHNDFQQNSNFQLLVGFIDKTTVSCLVVSPFLTIKDKKDSVWIISLGNNLKVMCFFACSLVWKLPTRKLVVNCFCKEKCLWILSLHFLRFLCRMKTKYNIWEKLWYSILA